MRGELEYPNDDAPQNEIDFWRRLPSHLIIIDEASQAPSLRTQINNIRDLGFIKSELIKYPYRTGSMETYFREVLFKNIYSVEPLVFSNPDRIECVKMKMLDMVGQFAQVLFNTIPPESHLYRSVFETLSHEIRSLHESEFHDLTYGLSEEVTSISWLGTTMQLETLFDQLQKPILDRTREIRFLDELASFDDFRGVFQANQGNKLKWMDFNPRNNNPSLSNLILLFKELQRVGLVPMTSIQVIRTVIKEHFYNLSDMRLSTLKPSKSKNPTDRALSIQTIVSSLLDT